MVREEGIMKKLLALVQLASLLACNSCVSTPAPAPVSVPTAVVDAGPAPVSDAAPAPQPDVDPGVRDACAKLAALHCAEGMSGCGAVLQKVLDERLTPVPLDCLVAATSKDAVRACGSFVACP